MRRFLLGVIWVAAAASAVWVSTTEAFPVRYSADQRFLIDQNGVPFPIMGRTAWFVTSLSVSDYHTFIDDTAVRGYNAIELHVVNHDARGNHPPFNGNGDVPFLNRLDGLAWDGSLDYGNINLEAPDFSEPNESYWTFVDTFLAYCETKSILVFLFPAYAGFQGGNQGWMQEMVANGPDKMQTYGAWIAARYRSQKNLVWMMGGDFGDFNTEQRNVESALLAGLKSVTNQQSIYFSAEWSSGMIATDQPMFGPAMTLNGTYSFNGDVNTLGRAAYAHTPVEPAFLLEEPYDQEGPDGNGVNPSATQPVRRFQWWGWLSSIGGFISGNGYVWPFRSPDWQQHLNSQGTQNMARLNAFISSIRWYKLVPSGLNGMRTLVTAGGGSSVSANDYVAATGTFDGTLLVAYVPPAHSGTITVDMAAMSGSSHARWFDPTSGAYSEIGSGLPNSGNQVFTLPGNNNAGDGDWTLIIDREVPPDTEPPVINITAPENGSIVSNTVSISAVASDNVGVVGVRFQVDGASLGAEIQSPPYKKSWDTLSIANGTHTILAIARDLAGNFGSNSISVTVSNDVGSPVVAAYGFSEGEGTTVADASGHNNTGAIDGSSWTSKGRFGNALTYDGTDWVTVEDAPSLDLESGMTLEAWVYPTMAPGTWTTIALKEAPPSGLSYMIQADPSNHPSAYVTTDDAGISGVVGPDALLLNTWTYLSATYDGSALHLYVNGKLVGSDFLSGPILTSSGPLRFGGNSIWGEYFVGTIDEVRIYNRALTPSEIQIDMITPVGASTPTPTPTISPTPGPSGTPSATPIPMPLSQPINLSTRMEVQSGDNAGIGGFILYGTASKHLLLRAIGPSLTNLGVPNALADPVLELHGPAGFVTITNDNWRDDPEQEIAILADGIPPADDRESAIDATLAPGAYTAIVRGKNDTSGVGLVEVYDLDLAAPATLINISTRAFVDFGNNIMIAGFILGGESGDGRIVVRGIGPSLVGAGVTNALADPTLELRDSNGAILMQNNNWQDNPTQAAELMAAGLAPSNDLESAIAATLPPGLYTVLLAGVSTGTGVGLVEVYDRLIGL